MKILIVNKGKLNYKLLKKECDQYLNEGVTLLINRQLQLINYCNKLKLEYQIVEYNDVLDEVDYILIFCDIKHSDYFTDILTEINEKQIKHKIIDYNGDN